MWRRLRNAGGAASSSTTSRYYRSTDATITTSDAGKGADALGLTGPVDPDVFRAVLEGKVPDGSGRDLGRRDRDGKLLHRPGRDVTLSAPKSVSLVGLVGGDVRVVDVHDRAVEATLVWIEGNAAETRVKDPATGRMVREGGQKMVAATFRHDTSRNLDPQLHTHAVIANMVQGEDGKWRSMANEKLYESKMLIRAIYGSELARGLSRLGYGIEKTYADGRFEIAGVSREAGMAERGMGSPSDNPRLAERAALVSRAAKRDIDRDELTGVWQRQAADLGFDAPALTVEAAKGAEREGAGREGVSSGAAAPDTGQRGVSRDGARSGGEPMLEGGTDMASSGRDRGSESVPESATARAVEWAVAHLSEREAVFSRTDLLTVALAWDPGKVTVGEAEAAAPMRARVVDKALRKGPLTEGQKAAVKLILSEGDRVVGVQGYAGSGKTTMLNRARSKARPGSAPRPCSASSRVTQASRRGG